MSRVRVRGWWLLPLAAAAVMAMPWPGWLVEYLYSRGVYPRVQGVVTGFSNLVPWTWIDVLIPACGLYLVWRLIRFVVRARERSVISGVWELMRRLLRTAALLTLVFLGLWGLNYRRVPLEHTLRGDSRATVSAEDMIQMAERAIEGSRVTRPADAAPAVQTYEALAGRLRLPFQQALSRLGVPALATPGRPKVSVTLTPFFTAAGVTGMINPLLLESIVHPDLLPFERPMVLAHEWAHLAGFADEADASAVAWLACTLGGGGLAYSAHVFVVIETAPVVPRELRDRLDSGVVEDLAALASRLARQRPAVREAAFTVYDGYLRSNRVADGVRSYSRVLRVLAALEARRAGSQ